MNKQFLNFLYLKKAEILKDIEKLKVDSKNPIAQCCENMYYQSEDSAKLSVKWEEFGLIDDIIIKYLNTYSTTNNTIQE